MDMALILAKQIVGMFFILIVGIIAYKKGIITSQGNKTLSDTLLMIVSPMLIFSSYQVEFNAEKFHGLLTVFVLAFAVTMIAVVVSTIFLPKRKETDYIVGRLSCVFPNCGYMGIPLISAIFGEEGVFYVSAYLTVFNFFLWTYAVTVISGKMDVKSSMKALVNPNIIAVVGGIICYIVGIRFPELIVSPMRSVSQLNTPMAMLIAGASLATADFGKLIKKTRIYYIGLVRLIIIPIINIIFLTFVHAPADIKTIIMICASCPCASAITSMALRYDRDSVYASEIFSVTTILSVVTIPAMYMLYSVFN